MQIINKVTFQCVLARRDNKLYSLNEQFIKQGSWNCRVVLPDIYSLKFVSDVSDVNQTSAHPDDRKQDFHTKTFDL